MRFVERKVLEVVLAEAEKLGYFPEVIEALGVDEEDTRVSQDRMQLRVIIEHADAWDAFSEITFRHVDEDSTFWVQFGWGNGVDVIHDYQVHTDAETIIGATTKEIEVMKIATIEENVNKGAWLNFKYVVRVQEVTASGTPEKAVSVTYTDSLVHAFTLLEGAVDSYKAFGNVLVSIAEVLR